MKVWGAFFLFVLMITGTGCGSGSSDNHVSDSSASTSGTSSESNAVLIDSEPKAANVMYALAVANNMASNIVNQLQTTGSMTMAPLRNQFVFTGSCDSGAYHEEEQTTADAVDYTITFSDCRIGDTVLNVSLLFSINSALQAEIMRLDGMVSIPDIEFVFHDFEMAGYSSGTEYSGAFEINAIGFECANGTYNMETTSAFLSANDQIVSGALQVNGTSFVMNGDGVSMDVDINGQIVNMAQTSGTLSCQ